MNDPYDRDPPEDPFERYFRPQAGSRPTDGDPQGTTMVGSRGGGETPRSRSGPAAPTRRRRSRAAATRRRAPGGREGARAADEPAAATGRSGGTTGNTGPPRRARRAPAIKEVRRKKRFLVAGALTSVVILLASGALWAFSDYAMSKISRVDPFAALEDRPQRGVAGAMNILIVGADRREGIPKEKLDELHLGHDEGEGGRSDTMILAHISDHQNRVVLVSLPRDSLVTIPQHRGSDGSVVHEQRAKLNAAYAFGGPSLAVATVERATSVHIDHYIEVNFLNFVNVVDALGGVKVCTPVPIDDERSGLQLAAGEHLLHGPEALGYVRVRYGLGDGSDLGRIERQQQFLASMMQRATSTGTLLNPVKLSRFLDAALSSVRADKDFSAEDMRALALELRDLSPSKLGFITVPVANPDHAVPGVGSTVQWDEQQAEALFQRIKNDEPVVGKVEQQQRKTKPTIPADTIQVEVYNAAGAPGLGGRTAHALRNVGFIVPGPAKNWPGPMGAEQTVIEYGPSRADSARTVQAAVPGSVLRKDPDRGDGIAVAVGANFSGTKQVQVAAAAKDQELEPKTAAQNPCK